MPGGGRPPQHHTTPHAPPSGRRAWPAAARPPGRQDASWHAWPRGPGRRKDELAAGTSGKPEKALSPNCRGGPFSGRRQTAATPRVPPPGRAAGIRIEPTGSRPPHGCKKRTCLRPAVHTQKGAGIGTGHVPRFSPDFVHVSGSAPGLRWPRSYSRLTAKMSPVSLFGRRRRAQIRTQSLSEPRSGSLRYEIHFHNPKSQRPLPPGGPALHLRPRFARPRPLLGPPFRRKDDQKARPAYGPHARFGRRLADKSL